MRIGSIGCACGPRIARLRLVAYCGPMTNRKTVEFFFDIGSSYSYLAATQIEAVAAGTGALVRWRPFLLGAVFKATGNEMPARVAAKARWMLDDMARWAAKYGVPFKMPSRFPLSTLRTQRALTAAARLNGDEAVGPFALVLFRAYWAEDKDVSSAEEIRAAAAAVGLDADAVIAAIDVQEIKDALRATTDEAVRRGAFGAPAMFVGDAMFWGNDRLDQVEDELRKDG